MILNVMSEVIIVNLIQIDIKKTIKKLVFNLKYNNTLKMLI